MSLNLVLGSNGIVTKSKEAVIENAHSTVYEALGVENSGFSIDVEAGNSKEDFLEYLYSKNLVNSNKVVNVPNLLGKSLKTGNGTEDDIYVITENETDGTYELEYKGTDKIASRKLGKIGYMTETDDEPSDESIFEFDKETGAIALKGAINGGYIGVGETKYEPIKRKKIVVPSEIDGVTVTKIGIKTKSFQGGNFYKGFGNPYVEEIVLPDTIVEIYGPSEFDFTCSHPGIFSDCSNLKKINIPEGVTAIGIGAFANCVNLENITLPNSLTRLESFMFWKCTNLKSVKLGNAMKSIGGATFHECVSLSAIDLPESITWISNGYSGQFIGAGGPFYGCTSLTSITFPNGMTSFPYLALENCTNLKTVTLPESITQEINSDYMFGGCESLNEINISENNGIYCSIDGVLYNKAKDTIVLIPNARSTCEIPESIKNINLKIFVNCKKLMEINVAENNENFSSEDGVLFNKDKSKIVCFPVGKQLKEYSIPESVKTIGDYAFIDNEKLENINIPENVTSLGIYAFCGCTGLTSIVIPDSVSTIGYRSFLGCTGLESAILSENITKISDSMFEGCKKLSTITIPDGVTSIGYSAFENCEKLNSIIIPSGVTYVSRGTFSGCNDIVVTVKSGTSLTVDDLKKAGIKEENIHFE